MPRLKYLKQRIYNTLYDHLIRTTGDPTPAIVTPQYLFGNANVGRIELTNLRVPGQLASDQTFVILAIRCKLYFNGTNRRANYIRTAEQLLWTLVIGEKPYLTVPTWYLPTGGGITGAVDDGSSVFSSGLPTHQAILKLARPIGIPMRQSFQAQASWFAVGGANALTGINTGATDDEKIIALYLDGLNVRDAE